MILLISVLVYNNQQRNADLKLEYTTEWFLKFEDFTRNIN